MHTFRLGMVHNEVKLCFSSLSDSKLLEFYSRIKSIKVLCGVGRLPTNIKGKDGLACLTAQQ